MTVKLHDRIIASFIFFTRLPFWRLYQPPKEAYATVVEHWPLVGWLTGGIMAATLFLCAHVLPYPIAVILAVIVRLWVTGALHEDGLADFFDGFGGGSDRQRILTIMKDSHIGTYGVIALIFYFALLCGILISLPPMTAVFAILAADPLAKMLSSQIVNFLPYARREEDAKNKTVYRSIGVGATISLALQGLLPSIPLLFLTDATWWMAVLTSIVVVIFLFIYIGRKLQGYTGDCCGAVCLLAELSFYMATLVLMAK
ncbi:MAG: adenosylcobinamide-GDP ribazoletransferase [Bacteroidaceae bacterium]|nr:adenosylcobinamide-GDP ribazoletransferase [Bacteroidaceae bacterium]